MFFVLLLIFLYFYVRSKYEKTFDIAFLTSTSVKLENKPYIEFDFENSIGNATLIQLSLYASKNINPLAVRRGFYFAVFLITSYLLYKKNYLNSP